MIIPFVTHGGSGHTLSLSREDVAESEEEIRQWAGSLR